MRICNLFSLFEEINPSLKTTLWESRCYFQFFVSITFSFPWFQKQLDRDFCKDKVHKKNMSAFVRVSLFCSIIFVLQNVQVDARGENNFSLIWNLSRKILIFFCELWSWVSEFFLKFDFLKFIWINFKAGVIYAIVGTSKTLSCETTNGQNVRWTKSNKNITAQSSRYWN